MSFLNKKSAPNRLWSCVAVGIEPQILWRLHQLFSPNTGTISEISNLEAVLKSVDAMRSELFFVVLSAQSADSLQELRLRSPHSTIINVGDSADSQSESGDVIDAHVPIQTLPDAVVKQLVSLAVERRRLKLETAVYAEELEQLNRHFHRVIDDKTREITSAKNRLTNLFQNVPAVMAAVTLQRKLEQAANALTGPHFFANCTLFLLDKLQGVVAGRSGHQPVSENVAEQYHTFRDIISQRNADSVVIAPEEGPVERPTLIITIKDHEGSHVGLALLTDGAEVEVPHPETLALVELFLTLTSQSVEQFRLERELEESEASYRSLIDNVGDVIFRIEPDGRLIFVSRQVSALLGEHWREVLGRSFFELLDERNEQELRDVFPYLLEGHFHTRDLTFRRADGQEIIAFVSLNPITEHGAITGVMGVARDVTEKRRLEKQIEESEQRYRALTENAYDAIVLIDPESYRIVDANPQALKLVGFNRNEFIGKSVFEIRHPEQAHEVVDRITAVMATGSGRFEDVPIVRRDGTSVFVDTAASVLELEGRKFYQAILRDMSVQRQMTADLNQRVLELQILVEVSDALQSSVDLQTVMGSVLSGVTAGSGLGFNRAFILTYDKQHDELRGEAGVGPQSAEEAGRIWAEVEARGLTLSEMMKQKLKRPIHEIDEEAGYARSLHVSLSDASNPFLRALRERDAILVDLSHEDHKLPKEFVQQYGATKFAIVPLLTRDDVIGVLLVDNRFSGTRIDDEDVARLKLFANSAASAIERGKLLVSLERRLHELTLANQNLKESRDRLLRTERLTAIGEVAASVAHEIRNPLAAIGGFARSVYGSLGDEDRNKSKMSIILEETDRLDVILNSILEFSRPTAPRFAEVDLNGLILQTVHFMDAEIDDTLIKVEADLDSHLPLVWADAGQIRQVFLNVFRNSIQEMPGGGRLTIRSSVVEGNSRVTVSDTGAGIPKDKLERIFDAFFSTKPTGSGLGLSICSQIVRNHNGRLEAQSEPSKGATFILTLPLAPRNP